MMSYVPWVQSEGSEEEQSKWKRNEKRVHGSLGADGLVKVLKTNKCDVFIREKNTIPKTENI